LNSFGLINTFIVAVYHTQEIMVFVLHNNMPKMKLWNLAIINGVSPLGPSGEYHFF